MDSRQKKDILENLIDEFSHKIYQIAFYYVKDSYLAEDLTQETFCRVYEKLETFQKKSSYYTWISRIAVNLCKDYLKSSSYKKTILAGSSLQDTLQDNSQKWVDTIEDQEMFSIVMELPTKYRVVLSLYYIDGYTSKEISQMINISESNVRTRLHRGRKQLEKLLTKEVGMSYEGI